MKLRALVLLAAFCGPVSASPVHISLKPTCAVSPTADGFFTLGSVADMAGGAAALRTQLLGIPIGRAPLSGETRLLTRGDIALKLRQAGYDPDKAIVLEGAASADVTTDVTPETTTASASAVSLPAPVPPALRTGGPILIHSGDAVTIFIQTGPLTITALGVARENGAAGAAIRVHRAGVATDLSVQVLDAKTVQLQI